MLPLICSHGGAAATQISLFGDHFSTRLLPGSDGMFAAETNDVILNPPPPGVSSGTCATMGCAGNTRFVAFGRPPAPPIK